MTLRLDRKTKEHLKIKNIENKRTKRNGKHAEAGGTPIPLAQIHKQKCKNTNNNNSVKMYKAPRRCEANQNLVLYYTTRIGKVEKKMERTIEKGAIYKNTP